MNPERWHKMDELFHSALELKPGERGVFLANACPGDLELRREVDSMLRHHDLANSFIESPVYEDIAETILADDHSDDLLGQTLGQYELLSVVGKGGMGVVYLAFDVELRRKVALKFLHDDLLGDSQRVQRFKQEARAASALNHPNILTIHQVGAVQGRQFIATEFVEGETLREIMKRRRLSIAEAVGMAMQITPALAAAHAADIIHRDIKPENVMVRTDGYIKVLDFGIAKLLEPASTDSNLSTLINTAEGTIIGTVQYMSPEQARGLEVDGRTDVWSVGVMLYEMITGEPPFSGDTKSDTVVAILEREPKPLTKLTAAAPAALEFIISKALQKEVTQRYQSANDLLADLRQFQEQPKAELNEPALATGARRLSQSGTRQPGRQTLAGVPAGSTSSAEYIVSEIQQHKRGAAIVLLIIAVAVIGLVVWLSKLGARNQVAPYPSTMGMNKLTASGKVKSAAISPDGKYIAYVLAEGNAGSFWLRQVGTTSDIQIAPPGDFGLLTFSPDGSYLYYKNFFNDLYQIPSIGGARKLVLKQVDSPVTFSPDGRQFAFVRDQIAGDDNALMIANADGTGERKLVTRKGPEGLVHDGPAWSPDGRIIVCAEGGTDVDGDFMKLTAFPTDGGREESILTDRSLGIGRLVWLRDGSGLVMLANERSSQSSQLKFISYPGGTVRNITNDLNGYDDVSISADASSLVSIQRMAFSTVLVTDSGDIGRMRVVTSAGGDYGNLAWAADDKLLYDSNAGGSWDIWSVGTKGSDRKQLTLNAGSNAESSASADGRYIVFVSNRTGTTNLWRMNLDGGDTRQLTNGGNDEFPSLSPDSQWIVFVRKSSYSGKASLWRVSINGGEAIQLTDNAVGRPAVSPDGKLIACSYQNEPGREWRVAIMPFSGGKPIKLLEIPAHPFWDAPGVKWSPDGRAITYHLKRDGIDNIWSQPISGGNPMQLTHFESDDVISFAWSRAGELAISHGTETGDIVLLKNFR
ncbi:MAG: eukaryotic-like serine/threonine-protein kinase [Blastocatellia bacterium]|jgi:serine/threonine protein kinase/Tol biopolymer transport system component|nr:eukaryotic-like serine/threonine-protein kinase [Blastocatellia bacterium]